MKISNWENITKFINECLFLATEAIKYFKVCCCDANIKKISIIVEYELDEKDLGVKENPEVMKSIQCFYTIFKK